jgi:hypothetical protein
MQAVRARQVHYRGGARFTDVSCTSTRAWALQAARAVFGSLFGNVVAQRYTVEEDGLDLNLRRYRWSWATIPLCYVVILPLACLGEATNKQPPRVATRFVSAQRYLIAMSCSGTLNGQVDFSRADLIVSDILFKNTVAGRYSVEGGRPRPLHAPTLLCRDLAHCGFE